MRTRTCLVFAVLALLCGLVAVSPAAAAPTPTYSAFITNDSSCQFYMLASWRNVKVDEIFVAWYEDGNFIFTTNATIQGSRAYSTVGPLYPTTTSHDWNALVFFYASSGEQLHQMYTNVDTADCGIFGQT